MRVRYKVVEKPLAPFVEKLTTWGERKVHLPKSVQKFLKMKRRLLRLKKLNPKLKARYPKWEQIENSMSTMLIAQRVGRPLPWSLRNGTWAIYYQNTRNLLVV